MKTYQEYKVEIITGTGCVGTEGDDALLWRMS